MNAKDIPVGALVKKALEMQKASYAPYSKYNVGCALLTSQGEIFGGCNIENIAFGPSVCAERVAFFKAISEGKKSFEAIAVVGGPGGTHEKFCAPCGVCRQVMREFCGDDFKIIMAKSPDDFKIKTLEELLPDSFKPSEDI